METLVPSPISWPCITNVSGEPGTVTEQSGMLEEVRSQTKKMLGQNTGVKQGIGGRPTSQRILQQGYVLEQNRPNPFKSETAVGFALPEAMEATITVYDVPGRVLRSLKGEYSKGYHTVKLMKDNLGGPCDLVLSAGCRCFYGNEKDASPAVVLYEGRLCLP